MFTEIHLLQRLRPLAGLFLLTIVLTLVGVFTRAIESLALFWPVNAILLGLLLRRPRLAIPAGWAVIYLGMVLSDLGTGNDWQTALWLNACNLGLIVSGWLILHRQPRARLHLRHPQGLLLLFFACCCGAALAATLASVAKHSWNIWLIWFGEQLSTCLLLLPVMLTMPLRPVPLLRLRSRFVMGDAWPLLALLLSLCAMLIIGGPGAIVFPLLPLLWCALRFSPLTVAVLGLISGGLEIVMVASNLAHFGVLLETSSIDTLTSARLGVAVLALGPLGISAANALNRRLVRRLKRRADHDFLTGTLTRGALFQHIDRLLEQHRHHGESPPVALLMLDLDHFKAVNDKHGHATGDRVLRHVAESLRQQLRQEDLLCRLGGEEFAALLPGITLMEAARIAERLRGQVERLPLTNQRGEPLSVTISIGVGQLGHGTDEPAFEHALARADEALYRAKAQGRNQVALAG